ncbi:MAG TPA: hypothetical protein VKU42_15125 [Candidatus Angelobacter sp.]|nr:hypothetical protein [Candidatus Angelobacter sp.]
MRVVDKKDAAALAGDAHFRGIKWGFIRITMEAFTEGRKMPGCDPSRAGQKYPGQATRKINRCRCRRFCGPQML